MTTTPAPTNPSPIRLPDWANDLIAQYESNSANQFILHGNVNDRFLIPTSAKPELGTLMDFLLKVLLPRFNVILSYDLGNGIRPEKGGDIFSQWPLIKESPQLLKMPSPRVAVETLTWCFRYCANRARQGGERIQVACVIRSAQLLTPNLQGSSNYDLSAMAMQIRDWSSDTTLLGHTMATFLVAENLNDLHPLLVNNTRAGRLPVPLPAPVDLRDAFGVMASSYPTALAQYNSRLELLAGQMAGVSLSSAEGLHKGKEYRKQCICDDDLVKLKKRLVEEDCNGLIEFIEPKKTLEDIHGQEKIKAWIRQDIALWKAGDLQALPMGYLLCGPVGTGKTFLVECIAGEAGVPVVKMKNFRDKWIGSTEGNLEKIFRLLHALGRCFVFIDEADQSLGKRESDSNDGGISGRVYSMMAEEMSDTTNRGKIVWVLASSRPDLIEVDLKRPGRIDVKIPIFPTTAPIESFQLIRALCKRRDLKLEESDFAGLESIIPTLLTPGAAEAIAVKTYRLSRTQSLSPVAALKLCLSDYRNPVAKDVMDFQIGLAVREASDLDFVPQEFRGMGNP